MERPRYTLDDWRTVKRMLSLGMTVRRTAETSGVGRNTVHRWSRRRFPPERMLMPMDEIDVDTLRSAAPRMSPRQRLTYEDRAYIAALSDSGASCAAIAAKIGVSPSTVSRELARNGGRGKYDPRTAEKRARINSRRPKARKIDSSPRLRKKVVEYLMRMYSPREIAERLKVDFPDDESMRLSHEAVYQAIYVQGKGSLRQELAVEQALRRGGSRRKPRSKLPPRPRGKSWVHGCEISARPPEAEDRAVPGHWEGDLVVGSDHRSCLVTLVERKTRFLVARRLDAHDTKTVVDLLIEMAGSVPEGIRSAACRSLTWDQGCEMADHARFTRATGFKVYFCDPHSPWQKGTNENTNGLIRQFFPKGTNFTKVTDEEVSRMQDLMNIRPRETLNWMNPSEALTMELNKARALQ